MADLSTLRDLHRRLREATGPDRELDAAICITARIFPPGNWYPDRGDFEFRKDRDGANTRVVLWFHGHPVESFVPPAANAALVSALIAIEEGKVTR